SRRLRGHVVEARDHIEPRFVGDPPGGDQLAEAPAPLSWLDPDPHVSLRSPPGPALRRPRPPAGSWARPWPGPPRSRVGPRAAPPGTGTPPPPPRTPRTTRRTWPGWGGPTRWRSSRRGARPAPAGP